MFIMKKRSCPVVLFVLAISVYNVYIGGRTLLKEKLPGKEHSSPKVALASIPFSDVGAELNKADKSRGTSTHAPTDGLTSANQDHNDKQPGGNDKKYSLWQLFGLKEVTSEALVRTWANHKALNTTSHNFTYKTCKQKTYNEVERNRKHMLAAVAQNFHRSLFEKYYDLFNHHLSPSGPLKEVALAMGSSADHFDEVQNFIWNISGILGNHSIILYDLGLTPAQAQLVREKCRFCEYRQFNFAAYPPHVKNLKSYAFKPLIVQEVLKDHEQVIWFDASILFKADEKVRSLDPFIHHIRKNELLIWRGPNLWNTVMTHPYTFSFFNEHPCSNSQTVQVTAGFLGVKNSPFVKKMIIIPWVACALERDCMYAGLPMNKNYCKRITRRDRDYSCHRFDQAALTVVLNRVYTELPQPPKKQFEIKRNVKYRTYFEQL